MLRVRLPAPCLSSERLPVRGLEEESSAELLMMRVTGVLAELVMVPVPVMPASC